jgi:hypothetical protein
MLAQGGLVFRAQHAEFQDACSRAAPGHDSELVSYEALQLSEPLFPPHEVRRNAAPQVLPKQLRACLKPNERKHAPQNVVWRAPRCLCDVPL